MKPQLALIIAATLVAVLLGLSLIRAGRAMRLRLGLGRGKTISLDNMTLISHRLGLVGRPDRLVKGAGTIVCEEWKSSPTLRPWHVAQLGVYFVLIEEQFRIRPPHGFIVTGDGARHRVENSDQLRASVLNFAEQIRKAKAQVNRSIVVPAKPSRCHPCGMRGNCQQARL